MSNERKSLLGLNKETIDQLSVDESMKIVGGRDLLWYLSTFTETLVGPCDSDTDYVPCADPQTVQNGTC